MSWVVGGFRLRLVPTLMTIVVGLSCFGLGVWQLERLAWKRGLIAQREAAVTAAPIAPPATLDQARALEFHPIVAEGMFLHDKESLLHTTGRHGAAGFDVLTPLRLADGHIVIINRGFVPTELKDPATRPAGQPGGAVRVSGYLRLPPAAKPNPFIPDNRPAQQEWFWIDLPAIAAADGLGEVAPYYIAADATPTRGGWPRGEVSLPELPNDHLQYAVTWFSLGVIAIVIYVLAERHAAAGNSPR